MRIMVIGATGTIGREVVRLLDGRHEVICVGHTRGDWQVDLGTGESIEELFAAVGEYDALICAAGVARFGLLRNLEEDDFLESVSNKLLGQVDLVRLGLRTIAAGGSFTLTSGILSQQPMHGSAAISMVNAGLEGFVRAAALELADRHLRVNAVSPPWVTETVRRLGLEIANHKPAAEVAKAYELALTGTMTGTVIEP